MGTPIALLAIFVGLAGMSCDDERQYRAVLIGRTLFGAGCVWAFVELFVWAMDLIK